MLPSKTTTSAIARPSMPPVSILVVYTAMVVLFLPTFYRLASYGWKNADYSHGPLILLAFCWLLWQKREFLHAGVEERLNICSLGLLLLGLTCYTTGSVFSSMVTESFALIPVFLGTTGLLFGAKALRRVLFPVCFLLFLVPPPAFIIDMITAPLQRVVTTVSAAILQAAGFMINRDGVILHIGDYTLIVGEVCSGLRSMISLLAVGAIYAYLQTSANLKRALLVLSIVPISIIANTCRLITLALVTHYFGDNAGQGFFHHLSGVLVFVIAMVCLVVVDVSINRRSTFVP